MYLIPKVSKEYSLRERPVFAGLNSQATPRCGGPKSKFSKNPKFLFVKSDEKQKSLQENFNVNGHTVVYHTETKTLE